jgi:hypothetical protein
MPVYVKRWQIAWVVVGKQERVCKWTVTVFLMVERHGKEEYGVKLYNWCDTNLLK